VGGLGEKEEIQLPTTWSKMARPQPLSPDDIGKIPEPALFFPNNFRYGVLINIGSGAVPGRLPNDAFREGSGGQVPGRVSRRFRAGSEALFGASSGQGSKEVPGQVPTREVRFRGQRFRVGSEWRQFRRVRVVSQH